MYFIPEVDDRPEETGLRGFSQAPGDEPQKSFLTIEKALDLNPPGGYVKGSWARRQLEEAFESVPPPYAQGIGLALMGGKSRVGAKFRLRLALPTQNAMIQILLNKMKALRP